MYVFDIAFLTVVHDHSVVVDSQYNELMGADDAWLVSEEVDTDNPSRDLRPTVSARRVKSLVEQVTGMCFSSPKDQISYLNRSLFSSSQTHPEGTFPNYNSITALTIIP